MFVHQTKANNNLTRFISARDAFSEKQKNVAEVNVGEGCVSYWIWRN